MSPRNSPDQHEEVSTGQRPLHVVACAHGTDNPAGRRLVDGLREDLAAVLAADGIHALVHEAYVDVQEPRLEAVLASLPPGEDAIVAPLLLSEGFHTSVDIAEAVATRAQTRTAAPIGPDARMAEVLAQRLAEAGHRPGDAVVLAAAGTRIEAGAAAGRPDGRAPGRSSWAQPVTVAYCSAATPSVPEAVAAARAAGASTGRHRFLPAGPRVLPRPAGRRRRGLCFRRAAAVRNNREMCRRKTRGGPRRGVLRHRIGRRVTR